jgi:hypothetical protein
MTAEDLKQGKWCDICFGDAKLHHMYIQDLAKEKGGKAYFKKIDDIHETGVWLCAKKHVFKEALGNVFYNNIWCPKCPVNYGQLLLENILEELLPTYRPKYLRTKTRYKNKLYVIAVDYFYKDLRLCIKYNGIDRYGFQDFVDEDKENAELAALDALCTAYKLHLLKVPYSVGYHELRDYIYEELVKMFIPVPAKASLLPMNALFKVVNSQTDDLLALLQECARKKRLVINLQKYPSSHDTKIAALCPEGHKLNITPRSIAFMESPCILCLHSEISRSCWTC